MNAASGGFARQNRAADAKRVWVGDLRITDSLFELTEQERNQVEAGREGIANNLYLVGDYEAAASIPIGATLARLEAEHDFLPAAFYEVLTTNLYKWMRVYDYLDAQEHAETWMEDLSDEELEASVYRKVDMEIPACIKRHSKTLKYRRARTLLQEIRAAHKRELANLSGTCLRWILMAKGTSTHGPARSVRRTYPALKTGSRMLSIPGPDV